MMGTKCAQERSCRVLRECVGPSYFLFTLKPSRICFRLSLQPLRPTGPTTQGDGSEGRPMRYPLEDLCATEPGAWWQALWAPL